MKKPTFQAATLGCKVNQAETASLEAALEQHGWKPSRDAPGVFLVNTCAVTGTSEAKSRRLINRIIREHPASRIVVTGCYASRNPEEINRYLRPNRDLLVRQQEKESIPNLLAKLYSPNLLNPKSEIRNPKLAIRGRTRAFLKIQDGCDNNCAYCIVPSLRDRPRSKSPAQTVAEAKELLQQGFREIVLVGINLGNHPELVGLLKALLALDGLERLRLSSIEITQVTDDLLDLMVSMPNLCPHLHLPLQSGSNRILKLMGRHYTAEEYLAKISRIKRRVDNVSITTDVIVGFPGETEADFQATGALAKQAGFAKIHIFPYSPRPGTPAAVLPSAVPAPITKKRAQELDRLQRQLALDYKKQFINRTMPVLLEAKGETGFTPHYLKVRLAKAQPDKVNQIIKVQITRIAAEYLTGTAVNLS